MSSLSCLRQLPVTMLKIDGSFVRDVLRDPRAESMVRAIAQLARSMSIVTVAEYIENEAISARIAELGVDYGQGFAIGKPIPLADLLTELPLQNAPAQAEAEANANADADADANAVTIEAAALKAEAATTATTTHEPGEEVTWYRGATR
jgi:predicted signal transduction protein with EAL and GGDEF domain